MYVVPNMDTEIGFALDENYFGWANPVITLTLSVTFAGPTTLHFISKITRIKIGFL